MSEEWSISHGYIPFRNACPERAHTHLEQMKSFFMVIEGVVVIYDGTSYLINTDANSKMYN